MNFPPVIAVAGASGFVGNSLRHALAADWRWRALTRSATTGRSDDPSATEWRSCDLFSLPKLETALAGCRYGIYLVHSMLPSSRLVQGNFRDMDLLLADNFARAAKSNGLEHIIYLGGLLPRQSGPLSPHLASRHEVEQTLRESGLPVTVLRAGLILGPGGSSTSMLINLVRRLPLMILPKWTRHRSASIDIRDVVRAFSITLNDKRLWGGTYDLATHQPLTYEQMILGAAKALHRRPATVRIPFDCIRISRRWVSWISGVPISLVGPLMESLTHDLDAQPNPLLQRLRDNAVPFERSVCDATDPSGRPASNPRSSTLPADRTRLRSESRVRSVQRMPLPEGWDAQEVAAEYCRWLSRSFLTTLFVEQTKDGSLHFDARIPPVTLLILTPTPYSRSTSRRRAFYISGGLLSRKVSPPGRFEFRVFAEHGCIIAAIHGFAPRLPWYLYSISQAQIHLLVMRAFARHLSRQPPSSKSDLG